MMYFFAGVYALVALLFAYGFGRAAPYGRTAPRQAAFVLTFSILWPLATAIGAASSWSPRVNRVWYAVERWLGVSE